MSDSFELLIRVEATLCTPVKSLKIGYLWWPLEEIWKVQIKLSYEHAKLSAPVTDMVDSEYLVALKLKNTADAITLNRGPKMANMHVLCDIGR